MRDYWLTQYLLAALGWGYIILALIALGLALWIPKEKMTKLVVGAIVLGLVSILPMRGYQEYLQEKETAQEFAQRQAKARALFEERCRTAGEKIYKTVDNVEGVLLKQVRSAGRPTDPMMSGAAAAHEFTGTDYIRYFLLYQKEGTQRIGEEPSPLPGYRYVDSFEADGTRYRYTLDSNAQLRREKAPEEAPRYAVVIDDIVDPREREYWIAGSKIVLIDLAKSEPLGEFIRYVIDPGQGSREGQRTPWLFAVGCGMKASYGSYSPQLFARRVLKPAREN